MKSFDHQTADDDLPFFGATKNLFYIYKVCFALNAYANANTKGMLWAPTHIWGMAHDSRKPKVLLR